MDLSADSAHLRITLDATLDAMGVEALIHQLAHARAQMIPGVPMSRPARDSDVLILEQDNPAAHFAITLDGGLRIWLRNHGLGWLAFRLVARDVDGVRQLLSRQIGDAGRPQ